MNRQIRRAALRMLKRNPRRAMQVIRFAVRHRRALTRTTRIARKAAGLAARMRNAADNPRVRSEASLAVSDLAATTRRVRELGVVNASRDGQIAARLGTASAHATRALRTATERPGGPRKLPLALGALSAAAIAILAIGRRRSQAE